jgi:hypothetical protein
MPRKIHSELQQTNHLSRMAILALVKAQGRVGAEDDNVRQMHLARARACAHENIRNRQNVVVSREILKLAGTA